MEGSPSSSKQTLLEPPLFAVIEWEADQFHRPVASRQAGAGIKDEINKKFEVLAAMNLIMLPGEVKRLSNTGTAEGFKECLLDLFRCQRRTSGMVVCDRQAVFMFREVRDSKSIEDFVWESRDNRRFGEVFNGSLRS